MTVIQSSTSSTSTSTSQTTDSAVSSATKTVMGQEDFFKLMIAQLKNQDPTKPVDGQQQLAQLAQFSTLQSIQEFQAAFEQFATDIKTAIGIAGDSSGTQDSTS